MTREMSASYTKLKDGSWGIRVPRQVEAGEQVTVTTKAGKQKTEVVTSVLWTGSDNAGNTISLCAIDQLTSDKPAKMGLCAVCSDQVPYGHELCKYCRL